MNRFVPAEGTNPRPERLQISVEIASEVYDEISRDIRSHPEVEVGGKYVGVLSEKFSAAGPDLFDRLTNLSISVLHHLDAGPAARRSPTSHYPDAPYQVALFRHLERHFPDVEHLGSWHSHHPNGVGQLSAGDIAHYFNAVNRPDHNHDLFLASLVTDRSGLARARHFLFVRGQDRFFELDPRLVSRAGTPSPYDRELRAGRNVIAGVDNGGRAAAATPVPVVDRARRQLDRDRTWLESDFQVVGGVPERAEWTGESRRPHGVAHITYRVPADFPRARPIAVVEAFGDRVEVRLEGRLSGRDCRGELHALVSYSDVLVGSSDER